MFKVVSRARWNHLTKYKEWLKHEMGRKDSTIKRLEQALRHPCTPAVVDRREVRNVINRLRSKNAPEMYSREELINYFQEML